MLDGLYMTDNPDLDVTLRWLSGRHLTDKVPDPFTITLNDEYGTGMPDFFTGSVPLMSDRMLAGLVSAGVNNVDIYKTRLLDPKTGRAREDYKAVQIIGRVKAANLSQSDVFNPKGLKHTAIQFRKLVIDEAAANGLLLFRLFESASTIVVHEVVKQALERLDLQFVTLEPLKA